MPIKFFPHTTQIIFFDLEFYVPKADRNKATFSFKFNPSLENHLILGGVFEKVYPLMTKKTVRQSYWLWKYASEKELMTVIYQYIVNAWEPILKRKGAASLIASGIAIERSDIPVLYTKFLQHQVDTPERIFGYLFNMRVIDLSVVSIPFFNKKKKDGVLYPKTKHDLSQRFNPSGITSSGKLVWDAYDCQDFASIEQRTNEEVSDLMTIFNQIHSEIHAFNSLKQVEKKYEKLRQGEKEKGGGENKK